MPVAKLPVYSNPTESIFFEADLDLEGFISDFSTRKEVGLSFELGVEDRFLSIGIDSPMDISYEMGLEDYLFHFYLNPILLSYDIDVELLQNYTEQLIPVQQVDSSDAVGRIDNLEMELSLISTNPQFYKEFSYSGSELSGYTIYSDSSKTNALFLVSFTTTNGMLSSKTILRTSDNKTLTISYGYSNGNLVSQTRIIS